MIYDTHGAAWARWILFVLGLMNSYRELTFYSGGGGGGSRETSTMFIFHLHLSGQQIIDSCYVVRLCKVCCFHAAIQGALVFLKVCV